MLIQIIIRKCNFNIWFKSFCPELTVNYSDIVLRILLRYLKYLYFFTSFMVLLLEHHSFYLWQSFSNHKTKLLFFFLLILRPKHPKSQSDPDEIILNTLLAYNWTINVDKAKPFLNTLWMQEVFFPDEHIPGQKNCQPSQNLCSLHSFYNHYFWKHVCFKWFLCLSLFSSFSKNTIPIFLTPHLQNLTHHLCTLS